MRTKIMMIIMLLMFGITAVQAQAQAQANLSGPGAQLKAGMDKLMVFMRQPNRPDEARLAKFLNQEIAPFFDFDYMAKSAAGPAYQKMSPAQRAKISKEIKINFLTTMAKRLTSYDKQRVRYLAHRVSADQRTAVVGVAILSPRSYPARLDFRFYKGKQGWRVFDVMANGQSAVVYYRRQFRQMMAPASQQRSYTPGYPYRR